MTIATFVKLFKERFRSEIQKKTGWGKIELLDVLDRLTEELLLEALEEKK